VRLNRRFAPEVYLGIMPLSVDPSGRLRLGGAGEPCDWLVKMVRPPAKRMFEAQIRQGEVDDAQLRATVTC
jgi:uncharacterized protein